MKPISKISLKGLSPLHKNTTMPESHKKSTILLPDPPEDEFRKAEEPTKQLGLWQRLALSQLRTNVVAVAKHAQSDIYFTQLTKQFERIAETIENGETVTLTLTEKLRSISLTIDRNCVKPLNIRLHSDNPNSYSFDIGDSNRQVTTDNIEALINTASHKRTYDKLSSFSRRFVSSLLHLRSREPKVGSLRLNANGASPGLPDPTLQYIDDYWVLYEDCAYTTNNGCTITAKKGFETDLASVPRLCWAFIAPFELSILASIVHDVMYRSSGKLALPNGEVAPVGITFTRQEADDIFLEVMERDEVLYWKRTVAYYAVRFGATSAWRELRID